MSTLFTQVHFLLAINTLLAFDINIQVNGAAEFNRFAIFRFQSIVLILEFNRFTAFSTSRDLDLNRFVFDL